tara:strand:- start:4823 stop:5980 length:1158 start_codon:yes stop_codon:yes gene_type:complete
MSQLKHKPEVYETAKKRARARIKGMTEDDIAARYPWPQDKPSLKTKAKSLAAAGKQVLRDITRHKRSPLAPRKESRRRQAICDGCEFYKNRRCTQCGCVMPAKVRLAHSFCPIGKWDTDMVSVIIPARNELYLARTIESLQTTAKGPIEVLVFFDSWEIYIEVRDQVAEMPGVSCWYNQGEAVGIRAGSNFLAERALGKYLFRVDGHCSFSEGWDLPLKNSAEPMAVVVPSMRVLNAETWEAERESHDYYYMDRDYRYQAFKGVKYPGRGGVIEIMAFIGAAWFCRKATWEALGGYDEKFYHWGESGIEWSLKTWLNGGRLLLDKRAWFAHLFRPKFPYQLNGNKVKSNRADIREHFKNYQGRRSIDWLVKKFKPLPGWHDKALN